MFGLDLLKLLLRLKLPIRAAASWTPNSQSSFIYFFRSKA
uniref:Uncharacterized protein n=1 Tax=Rhizophora mucronata TaxID=61149 RepID=A0A2P2P5Z5_RHIMU